MAAAALVYAGLYAVLPESIARRDLFAVSILPAFLVIWIRRHIDESAAFPERRRDRWPGGSAHLLSAFRGPHLWTTVRVSLMVAGAQGGVYVVGFWMPTCGRCAAYPPPTPAPTWPVQALGALIGFLLGAYLSDAIGRKWTFFLSAIATVTMLLGYMFVPMGDVALLPLGIPLKAAILMKFSPMGPFMTELYPTAMRATGQGFCYNGGRAIGSLLPTVVGLATQILSLGAAIAIFCVIASSLMIVMLLLLPETRGRSLTSLETGLASTSAPGLAVLSRRKRITTVHRFTLSLDAAGARQYGRGAVL